jgi:hypothetical protein
MPAPKRRTIVVAAIGAATLVGGGATFAATANAAAAGCRVDYKITNQWSTGFGADVTVTNLGDALNGWALTWSFGAGQSITQGWNATVTQSGSAVRAANVAYNPTIATNGTVNFGFNASITGSNPVPSSFALNGVACTGSTTPTTGPTSPSAPPSSPSAPPSSPSAPPSSPSAPPSTGPTPPSGSGRQAEDLDRGVISVRSGSGNLVSWRLLGTEWSGNVAFNVYRGSTKVNSSPITGATNILDSGASASESYTVRAVVNGAEQAASPASLSFASGYRDVPIQSPGGGNDASVGDLDGDGQYEFVLKWDPSDAKDNSQAGVTGNVYIDAYKLNGTRMWRINLGRNIRAGAHYTQFQVYDYDGDGRAEVAMKTADGTTDGTGRVIGNASADYRNASGYVLTGPEFLTMFSGQTGAALSTVNYDPPRGTVSGWGDSYGNRVDRFLAGTAYLDGQRPSLIMARGYYTRTVVAAWDFRNGTLTKRWTFDSNSAGSTYTGEGNHQLSIADADADGRDEIMYGSMAINDNGQAMWDNNTKHGDAYHVGDFIPSRPGLEVFKPSEHTDQPADWIADARTGATIWRTASCGCDNGRGVAADIYAGNAGAEVWSAAVGGLRSAATNANLGTKPSSMNFLAWWDADTTRELLDRTMINKYGTGGESRLLTAAGVVSINGTKATPSLSGDILGDWREEVVWPTANNSALRIYSTPNLTTTRLYTLMHDIQYREAIAWQNTAYNQPPHPSFHIGNGMATPPTPSLYLR